MRAVDIRGGKGDAEALFINENIPDPVAERDRVVVRIKAFGLNRMDIMQREAAYPLVLFPESGKILGVEYSGTVEEKGPDCKFCPLTLMVLTYILGKLNFNVGDRVFGLAYGSAVRQLVPCRRLSLTLCSMRRRYLFVRGC